jgi:DNA-binding transcriptional MerR regulator
MDVPLAEIKRIVSAENFGGMAVLENYLGGLYNRRNRLDLRIANVEKTIAAETR